MLETYHWAPEETLSRPWAQIVELLEARAKRLERGRADDEEPPARRGANVTHTDNPAAFGLGSG